MIADEDISKEELVRNTDKGVRYYLGAKFPDIYFTQQEARCMKQFLKGCSIAKTAVIMNLSPRTIEFYLSNMKCKLKCHTKAELIEKVFSSNFRDYIDIVG